MKHPLLGAVATIARPAAIGLAIFVYSTIQFKCEHCSRLSSCLESIYVSTSILIQLSVGIISTAHIFQMTDLLNDSLNNIDTHSCFICNLLSAYFVIRSYLHFDKFFQIVFRNKGHRENHFFPQLHYNLHQLLQVRYRFIVQYSLR